MDRLHKDIDIDGLHHVNNPSQFDVIKLDQLDLKKNREY
jgi:hypothetical protein